jgi:hypothetical protein
MACLHARSTAPTLVQTTSKFAPDERRETAIVADDSPAVKNFSERDVLE